MLLVPLMILMVANALYSLIPNCDCSTYSFKSIFPAYLMNLVFTTGTMNLKKRSWVSTFSLYKLSMSNHLMIDNYNCHFFVYKDSMSFFFLTLSLNLPQWQHTWNWENCVFDLLNIDSWAFEFRLKLEVELQSWQPLNSSVKSNVDSKLCNLSLKWFETIIFLIKKLCRYWVPTS